MKRDGNRITGSWTVPSSLTKSDSDKRATKLQATGTLSVTGGKKSHKREYGASRTSYTVNVNDFDTGSVAPLTRNSFYPKTKKKLGSVTISVVAGNDVGWSSKKATGTYAYKTPRKPAIDEIEVNAETGELSTTITTDEGADKRERYDTEASYTVVDTLRGKTRTTDITHRSTTYDLTYDVTDYQELSYDDYVCLTVKARARGLAGASKWVTRSYYMSYPAKPTVKRIDVSGKDSTGKVTVHISTNATKEHPVDRVELETLVNTSYESVSDIPADAAWTPTGIVDDGNCTALALPTGDVKPSAGHFTWVRVKAVHAIEDVLYRYSAYKRVEALEAPARTAADDDIAILDATSGADGSSAVVQLGWNADGTDDSTGTELSWSDDKDAWRSTDDPDTHEFSWSDGPVTSGGTTYRDSAVITIKKLSEGVPVYIRARRYLDGEDSRTYSAYSNAWSVIPSAAPDGVVAMADRYVARGEPLLVEWTFGGGGTQTSWAIVDSSGTTIAGDSGTDGSYSIGAERLESLATDNSLTFSVQVSTGGDPAVSEQVTVTIVDAPTLTASVASTVTAQPVRLSFTSTALCDLTCVIASDGASGQTPAGIETQAEGAVVWSDVISPDWSGTDGAFTCTYDVPATRGFWDGVGYTLAAIATDRETGLRSEPSSVDFGIDWARKAPDPDAWATVTPLDYTDGNGVHHLAAELALSASGAAETDVLDVYRLTGDGPALIGADLPLNYTVIDDYAPFGPDTELAYRVACRTVDGSQEFADVGYALGFESLRFDWANGYLELPYEISIADSYAKKSKLFEHQDGSNSVHHNPGVNRSTKLGSAIVRADSADDIAAARAMARHAGTVFVRTPDGSAYEADVQVSDLSGDGVLLSIGIDNREVALSETYMLPAITADEEAGE